MSKTEQQKHFPHLDDTKFPNVSNVNTYKYQQDIDYEALYGDTEVTLKMLNVPWCGNYDNVCYFDSEDSRDEWFNNKSGTVITMHTMTRLYNGGTIKVDVPIDKAIQYNYLWVDYGKLPAPIGGETVWTQKQGYFINTMTQVAASTTELRLQPDMWTTYIHRVGVSYVSLWRGHWPVANSNVVDYLSNPLDNNEYLLTPDVTYGNIEQIKSRHNVILNGDGSAMYLCFVTNGTLKTTEEENAAAWGSSEGKYTTYVDKPFYFEAAQGYSNNHNFAILASGANSFMRYVDEHYPTFWSTVKCMFLAPASVLTLSDTAFTFGNKNCFWLVTNSQKLQDEFTLDKKMFGYDDKYNDLAKLYTYPYAAIEVNNFHGTTDIIKIETIDGSLSYYTVMNDMYPYICVDSFLGGIGGSNVTISFKASANNTFVVDGRSYNFETKHHLPVFGVQFTIDDQWNLKGKIGADTAKENAYASATTAQTCTEYEADALGTNATRDANVLIANTAASMATLVSNATRSGQLGVDNAALQVAANTANVGAGNTSATTQTGYTQAYNQAVQAWNAGYSRALQATDAEAATMSAGVSVGTATLGAVGNVVGSVMNGDVGGAVSSAVNGVASGINTAAQTAISVAASASKTEAGVSNAQQLVNEANTNAGDNITLQVTYANTVCENNNSVTSNTAANAKSCAVSNASATQSTNNANAERSANAMTGNAGTTKDTMYNTASTKCNTSKANADRSYNADYAQCRIDGPNQYGQATGTPELTNHPLGVSYNVVTQNKSNIRHTAEQFLRYGYTLDMEVNVTDFNVMPKFSYWKCSAVYCNGYNVHEGVEEAIKNILINGTTVWKSPEYMNNTSIYANK